MTRIMPSTSGSALASASRSLRLLALLGAALASVGCGEAADAGALASPGQCQQACDHAAQLCGPTSYDCVQFCLDQQAPQGGIDCALAAGTCQAARSCYGGTLPDQTGAGGDDPARLATRDECQQACDQGTRLCGPMSYDCVQFCLDQQAPLGGIDCALRASSCEEAQDCYGGQLPE